MLVAGALLSGVGVGGWGGAELEVSVWALLFTSGLTGLVFFDGRASGEQPSRWR